MKLRQLKKVTVKNSCGGQGCAYKPYYAPMGIKRIALGNKNLVKKIA
jgi:hypothetical protein